MIVHSNPERQEEKIGIIDQPTVENDLHPEEEVVHTMANQQTHTEASVMAEDFVVNQADRHMHLDQDNNKNPAICRVF